jgi:short-chain Z-isoprenyl diphosphate synthase
MHSTWRSAMWVNEMNFDRSPAHERVARVAFDKQDASVRLDAWQKPTERKPSGNGTVGSLLLRFLYWIYERRLLDQLKRKPMPRHIGIILDGNRRHARKRGLNDPCEIYQRGAQKLDDILDWCAELRIHAVTLWVFSTENLKRSQAEVSGILSAIETKVAALAQDPLMHQKRIRIQAIGRLDLLPEPLIAAIRAAETATAQYDLMTLTIAVGYGGREEIADAVRSFVKMQAQQGSSLSDVIERITPEAIARHLYAADLPDPDLIIRTSGEIRLSGFLLWQSVHSEFYFTDVLWPAFRKVDFLRAIRAYQARNRRFGR